MHPDFLSMTQFAVVRSWVRVKFAIHKSVYYKCDCAHIILRTDFRYLASHRLKSLETLYQVSHQNREINAAPILTLMNA